MTPSVAAGRSGSRRRRVLGLRAIVDVAVRLVDREGVDAVSMRRVAAEFDTGPASLYAHVANKEQLLRLVLDRVLSEVAVPEGGDWSELLRRFAHGVHDVFRRHNDAARLSFGIVPEVPRALEVVERLLSAMIAGGVPAQVAAWTLDSLSLYVAADAYEGWLQGQRFATPEGRDPEEVGLEYYRGVARRFAELPAERYPTLVAHVTELATGSGEERFAFGVEMFIAGVAAQVSRRTGNRSGRGAVPDG